MPEFKYINQINQIKSVCTQNEAGSINERKGVAWDDVAKRFLFHKAAVLTNLVMRRDSPYVM